MKSKVSASILFAIGILLLLMCVMSRKLDSAYYWDFQVPATAFILTGLFFALKINVLNKNIYYVLLVFRIVILVIGIGILAFQPLLKGTSAYKEAVFFIRNDTEISTKVGNVKSIGFFTLGGNSEEDGRYSTFYFVTTTETGNYDTSVSLYFENKQWKVISYELYKAI